MMVNAGGQYSKPAAPAECRKKRRKCEPAWHRRARKKRSRDRMLACVASATKELYMHHGSQPTHALIALLAPRPASIPLPRWVHAASPAPPDHVTEVYNDDDDFHDAQDVSMVNAATMTVPIGDFISEFTGLSLFRGIDKIHIIEEQLELVADRDYTTVAVQCDALARYMINRQHYSTQLEQDDVYLLSLRNAAIDRVPGIENTDYFQR